MVGAGGAGGTCCAGGGGYCGGGSDGQYTIDEQWGVNGERSKSNVKLESFSFGEGKRNWAGGSYFEGVSYGMEEFKSILGGKGNFGSSLGHEAGNGGQAGKGGIVRVSSNAKIYAFNGNKYTDGTPYNDGENECPIYCQAGIILPKYEVVDYLQQTNDGHAKATARLVEEQKEVDKLVEYKNLDNRVDKVITMNLGDESIELNLNTQGIGSGAGYIELDNGSYTIDASLN